tara:strand:+ start:76 stop:297 length:222 start_codon:yes stop_codon:yes gene_type:complete
VNDQQPDPRAIKNLKYIQDHWLVESILDIEEEPREDLRAEYVDYVMGGSPSLDYRKEEAASLGLDWPPQWPPC